MFDEIDKIEAVRPRSWHGPRFSVSVLAPSKLASWRFHVVAMARQNTNSWIWWERFFVGPDESLKINELLIIDEFLRKFRCIDFLICNYKLQIENLAQVKLRSMTIKVDFNWSSSFFLNLRDSCKIFWKDLIAPRINSTDQSRSRSNKIQSNCLNSFV